MTGQIVKYNNQAFQIIPIEECPPGQYATVKRGKAVYAIISSNAHQTTIESQGYVPTNLNAIAPQTYQSADSAKLNRYGWIALGCCGFVIFGLLAFVMGSYSHNRPDTQFVILQPPATPAPVQEKGRWCLGICGN